MHSLTKIALLGLAIILLNACILQNEAPIDADKMQNILRDIHLAEAENQQTGRDSVNTPLPRNKESLSASYAAVYKHYEIDEAAFKTGMDWYRNHPALLDSIYTKLIPEMSVLQAKAEALEKPVPANIVKDSVE